MNISSESSESNHSVTEWLVGLKAGDPGVASRLWQRYVEQLARLARRKIGSTPRRLGDEEDAANQVFHALLQGIEHQRFPELKDRQDLWQILIMLTERQAIAMRRREFAAKRGGGKLLGESALQWKENAELGGMEYVMGSEPSPEFAALCAENLSHRLSMLSHDPHLAHIASDKLSGYANQEIADRLGISLRTVERNLSRIRQLWSTEDPS
ncbi:MAG: ECF-type sigma factor [Pirellula sp.]|jgi:DNA-directed RNA polymerase specialized sigma24 family protein